jgi:hypothetical protein
MLPYFLRYYTQFGKVIIYDNQSTDDSVDIALAWGAEVRTYDTGRQIKDDVYLEIKNNCWKGQEGWVCVCDVDEFFYHPDLLTYLKFTKESIIHPQQYEMYSENLPTTEGQIFEEITKGIHVGFGKMGIFRADKVKEINYEPGCHVANPTDKCVDNSEAVKMLHYKYLNRQYVIDRYKMFAERLSDKNKTYGWGNHYNANIEAINKNFDEYKYKAIQVL